MFVLSIFSGAVSSSSICNPRCADAEGDSPQALSLSPRKGPTVGGQQLRVEGLSLSSVRSIDISVGRTLVVCGSLRIIADNMIECTTGAAPEGEGQVLLRAPCRSEGMQEGCITSRLRYEYVAVRVRDVAPVGGPPSGATQLIVHGAGFELNQVKLAVDVGGLTCSGIRLEQPGTLSCNTMPLPEAERGRSGVPLPVNVHVSVGRHSETHAAEPTGGTKPTFTYAPSPEVTHVSPAVGPVEGGTTLTIRGRHFGDNIAVTIRGAACVHIKQISELASQQALAAGESVVSCVTTRAPAGVGSVDLWSKRGGRALRLGEATVFRYAHLPRIESLNPSSVGAAGGTVLTLSGERFGQDSEALLAVTIDGQRCLTLTWDSPGFIGCTTPPLYPADGSALGSTVAVVVHTSASAGNLTAKRAAGIAPLLNNTLPSEAFLLPTVSQPRISSLRPSAGPIAGGTRLTISGSGLGTSRDDLQEVLIGGLPCTDPTISEKSREVRCTTAKASRHGTAAVSLTTTSRGRSVALPPPPDFVYLPQHRSQQSALTGSALVASLTRATATAPASATASDSCCGRLPERAVDGDLRTEWRSGAAGVESSNLTLDLGSVVWLGMLDVWWGWEYEPEPSWTVQTSIDGDEWQGVPQSPEAVVEGESGLSTDVSVGGPSHGFASCGWHVAPNCSLCPRCGDEWCGEAWCGGDCQWNSSNATCVVASPPRAAWMTRRERRLLASHDCRHEHANEPKPGSGCVAARYVRLAMQKRAHLTSEPIILKEVRVMPLEAMVDGASIGMLEPGTTNGEKEATPPGNETQQGVAGAVDRRSALNGTAEGRGSARDNGTTTAAGSAHRPGAENQTSEAADDHLPLAPWAVDLLPLLRPGFAFESVGIGGLDKELRELFRRVVVPRLVPPSTRASLGLHIVRGALLYGPPGTGKSLTARKIGDLLHVPPERTAVVDGPALVSKFLGESERNLRELFVPALEAQRRHGAAAPLHIIIFDEIDAICRARGHTDQSAGLVYDSLVNQLLSIMDGVAPLDNILLLGMTNRKDLIDPALLRAGRFEVRSPSAVPRPPACTYSHLAPARR